MQSQAAGCRGPDTVADAAEATARLDNKTGLGGVPYNILYTDGVTTPIPTRFSEQQTEVIDRLIAAGVGTSRSDVIRRAVDHFADSIRRTREGEAIAASYRRLPQGPEEDAAALANAIAMTEAEPW